MLKWIYSGIFGGNYHFWWGWRTFETSSNGIVII